MISHMKSNLKVHHPDVQHHNSIINTCGVYLDGVNLEKLLGTTV